MNTGDGLQLPVSLAGKKTMTVVHSMYRSVCGKQMFHHPKQTTPRKDNFVYQVLQEDSKSSVLSSLRPHPGSAFQQDDTLRSPNVFCQASMNSAPM